jgi:RNA polymerase sigma factor (TIGR02999 family)
MMAMTPLSGARIPPAAITELLRAVEGGDKAARDRLFAMVYGELRGLARGQLRRIPGRDTLSTTALVNETYLKLAGDRAWSARDRSHFFALAARAMRQILVDHARSRARQKRGGGVAPVSLAEALVPAPDRAEELLALDEALKRLEAIDAELAQIVEWRFFGGLSIEEVAGLLAISDRTVKRHWRAARAYLFQQLQSQGFGA